MTQPSDVVTQPRPPRAAVWISIATAALLAIAVAVSVRVATSHAGETEAFGVRLGSSLADTRDRFRPPTPGDWTSAAEPEPVLRWKATTADAAVHSAVFEFHSGMLVATRFDLDSRSPEASGAALVLTRGTVLSRRPADAGHVTLTVLARDCPVHQDEIKRLVATGS